jgi:hypothetical protein
MLPLFLFLYISFLFLLNPKWISTKNKKNGEFCFYNKRIYFFIHLCLFILSSEAKYPVQVNDSRIKYSPRPIGRTSIAYNNEMHIYGGELSTSDGTLLFSKNMYKYSFDTDNDIVSLSLVD